MSANVYEITEELKKAILECPEYREYQDAAKSLEKTPALKRDVNQFRNANFYYQIAEETGFDNLEQSERLNAEFTDKRKLPEVAHYLNAEMKLCRLMQSVCNELFDSLEFDVDFIE